MASYYLYDCTILRIGDSASYLGLRSAIFSAQDHFVRDFQQPASECENGDALHWCRPQPQLFVARCKLLPGA
jgi:hypothetical protein